MRKVRWIQWVVASAFVATFLFADVASAQCCGRVWGRCWGRRAAPVYRCAPTRPACSSGWYSGACSTGVCSAPTAGACSTGVCSVPAAGACSTGDCSVPASDSDAGASCSVPAAGACSTGDCSAPASDSDAGASCSVPAADACSEGTTCGYRRAPTAGPLYETSSQTPEERFVELANRSRNRPLTLSDRLKSACVRNSQYQNRFGLGHYGFNTTWELATPGKTPESAIGCFFANRFKTPHWNLLTSEAFANISVGFFGRYCTVQLW